MTAYPDLISPLRSMLFDDLPVGIAVVSLDAGRYVFRDTNRWIQDLTGYEHEAMIGKPVSVIRGPRTRPQSEVSEILSDPNRIDWMPDVIYTSTNEPRAVEIMMRSLSIDGIGEGAAVMTFRDVSRMAMAVNAQTLSNQISDLIRQGGHRTIQPDNVASVMCGAFADWCAIHMFTPNGRLELAAMCTSTGEPIPERARDVPVSRGIGVVARSRISMCHQTTLPTNPLLISQMEQIVGQTVNSVACVPIAGYTGELYGAATLCITRDNRQYHVSEIDAIEEAALKYGHYLSERATRESLSDALVAREGFMIAAGHELRTPLVSIKGYTQMLLRGLKRSALSQQRLESGLKAVDESASRLGTLMEELLSTTTGNGAALMPLRTREVDLGEFIREFCHDHEGIFSGHHRIDAEHMESGTHVVIDPNRFAQVLHNVLLNAVQYSPAESTVRVALERGAETATVTVTDEGVGLDPSAVESIFDVFTTAGPRLDSRDPGLGIGLFISRQIVNRHGGRIWAESEGPQSGTSILIEMPLSLESA